MLQESAVDKAKKTIDPTDWFEKMNGINLPKQQLNKLIMNFFVVEGLHGLSSACKFLL